MTTRTRRHAARREREKKKKRKKKKKRVVKRSGKKNGNVHVRHVAGVRGFGRGARELCAAGTPCVQLHYERGGGISRRRRLRGPLRRCAGETDGRPSDYGPKYVSPPPPRLVNSVRHRVIP